MRRALAGLVLAAATAMAAGPPVPSGGPTPDGTATAGALAPLPFDRLLRHSELTELLQQWVAQRPGLCALESIGTTPEGRDLWLVTLTNVDTGPALEKPALMVEGSVHAVEWTGGVAALHLIRHLLAAYGKDQRVTQLLDTRAVYVVPRLSPDGVDAHLETGRFLRSVPRPHLHQDLQPGLHMGDANGDGRVVFMRLRDDNGPWKQHPNEPRLLIARQPDETGGTYWRVMPEGFIAGFDGETISLAPPLEGLDLGSAFPGDPDQPAAAGDPEPDLEPEIAAYLAAMRARLNISAHISCHTFGGLVLTPPVNLTDPLPDDDRMAYAVLTARAAALTGYSPMSYLDLRGANTAAHVRTPFAWLYNARGILSYITEFWNPLRAAGISLEGTTASAWLWGHHPVEDELALLRWNDETLGGDGFLPWAAFDHPQLGAVEIGGWDLMRYWYNPPPHLVEQEVAPHTEWLIFHGLALPQLQIRSFSAEPAAPDTWRIRLVIENTGWLPTHGTQQALDRGAVGEVTAVLEVPSGVQVLQGEVPRLLGQLAGRTAQRSTSTWWSYTPGTPDRALAEWLVQAPPGARISATVSHQRAGTARAALVLP